MLLLIIIIINIIIINVISRCLAKLKAIRSFQEEEV